MKSSEAAEITMMLMAAYPHSKAVAETSAVYERMLLDLDASAARRAVERLIATSKWMPTVAEIREACVALDRGPRRTGAEAWGDALEAVRSVSVYGVPKWRDPLAGRAVDMVFGSWVSFCNSPDHDPAGRARFLEVYDALAERERQDVTSGRPLPKPMANERLSEMIKKVGGKLTRAERMSEPEKETR